MSIRSSLGTARRALAGLALALGLAAMPAGPAHAGQGAVTMAPPEGFLPRDGATGFQNGDATALIDIQEIPEALAKVAPAYGVPALEARGATLRSYEKLSVAGQPATLVCVLQRIEGVTSERWVLLFGNPRQSVVINAHYPRKQAGALRQAVREALLSTQWAGDDASPAP